MDVSNTFRSYMAMWGAAAGLAFWLLTDWLPDRTENDRLILFLVVAMGSFFCCLKSLAGTILIRRLLLPAIAIGLVLGGLTLWASFRFETVGPYLKLAYPIVAPLLALTIAIPFTGAALLGPWRDYKNLFEITWNTIARLLAALVFTGVVWAMLFLSDALLKIVGLDVIERLLLREPVSYLLTGAVFGLALAVVHEMRSYISPDLLLRLLRLLVPFVLAVTCVFLGALPFRGLSGLVGGLSPAATLLAVALAAVVLVTVALDCKDTSAVQGPRMQAAVRALASLVPVLAGLALYALWLRVDQHGLTPRRIWALTAGVVTLVYGLTYVFHAWRSGWMDALRRTNINLALIVLATSLAWLTPLFSPEVLSARSQARLLRTAQTPDRTAIYEMTHEWGHPGRRALADLADQTPKIASLAAKAADATSLWAFVNAEEAETGFATVQRDLLVLPKGTQIAPDLLQTLPSRILTDIARACERAGEDQPGCVLLKPQGEPVWLLFLRDLGPRVTVDVLLQSDGKLSLSSGTTVFGAQGSRSLPLTVMDQLQAGDFSWGPVQLQGLSVGNLQIIPDN